jgi:serine/threonine protein kinase
VQKMLRLDPSKRITARAALEHDYFRDLEHA